MSEKCYTVESLQKYQNNPFIYVRNSINEEIIFNYKTIIQETKKLIQCLEKYKLEKSVGIAIDLKEHSPATCVAILGILNSGCHFFCLNLKECKDVDNYLRLSGVKYIISSFRYKKPNILKDQSEKILIFNETYFLLTILSPNNNFNVNVCYTIATSGTTGQPKMVHVPYDCILPNIKSLSSLLNVQSKDMVFFGSPPTFDPFVVEFFIALMNGTSLLITSNEIRLKPQLLFQILFPENISVKKGVTIYQTTPSLFRLFDTKTIENILSESTSLRCLILGGEEFPSLFEFKTWLTTDFEKCNKRIFNIYGITEISCWSSICEFIPSECSNQRKELSIGKPLDEYTQFRISDETGNVLLQNSCKGELEIGSDIRRCYIPECDNNKKILKQQKIIYRKTGDLVERDELGNIFYLGRVNNTIKRMGKRINLDSLNKKLDRFLIHNGVSSKAVALWSKEFMKLIFYLVDTNGLNTEQKQFIQSILQHNLENYEHPDEIVYSAKPLPLNKNGKVDRFKILEEISKNKSPMAPTAIFKNFLKNILNLNVDNIENSANHDKKRIKMISDISFAGAGGTSFQALSLAAEMTKNIANARDQRKILEMLLDNEVSINEIVTYLHGCENNLGHLTCFLLPNKDLYNLKFKLMWRCDLQQCVDASPTAYNDVIAVGSHSHLLLVVDGRSGEEISKIELPDRIECPVVFVTSDLAVVGCYDGFLYGFNYRKGSIIWNVNVKGMIKAKPLVIKNLVIVASYAEKYNVGAYDLETLALKWHIKFGTKGIFSSPLLITEELVLLCSLGGSYGLAEIGSGFVKWQKKLDSPIFATAAKIDTLEETLLVLAEVKGQVSVCKARNGEKVTSYQAEGNIFSGISLHKCNSDNYFIIFGCHDKNVYCLNFNITVGNLTLIWKYFMNSPIFSTPITISNCYILCCSTKGTIALSYIKKAESMASYDLKAEIFSTPVCLDNRFIYFGSRDNSLYAFELL